MKNIGFIGLGIMGSRMAANLLNSNHNIVIYNRTREKANELVARGAELAESLSEVGDKCDIVFTMLSTPEVVKNMAAGDRGFLRKMSRNGIWIDCSTVGPEFSKEMGRIARSFGLRFIDAPVSGTKGPAEKGQLIFLAGGDPQDVDEIKYLLEYMGKAVVYTGENGTGSAMKLVINTLLGQTMVAFCESIALGTVMGLPMELIIETLKANSVISPFLSIKSGKIQNSEYEPEFPLQWMHKDLHLAANTAYNNNIALPALNIVKEIFGLAKSEGFGENDLTAVFEVLKSRKEAE